MKESVEKVNKCCVADNFAVSMVCLSSRASFTTDIQHVLIDAEDNITSVRTYIRLDNPL